MKGSLSLLAAAAMVLSARAASASFTFSKSAVAGDVYPGGQVKYLLAFSRTNFLDTGVVLHDRLPASHTLVSVDGGTPLACPGSGPIGGGLTAVCDAGGGDLQIVVPNSTSAAMVTLTYQVAASLTSSTNSASATCNGTPCGASPTASKMICVPQVSFSKTVNPQTVLPGQVVSYTLTATNTGSCPLAGYSVGDSLPAGLTFQSLDAPNATSQTGQTVTVTPTQPLAVGASYTITIRGAVGMSTPQGTLTNTATASLPGGGSVTATAPLTVSSQPAALMLSKSVSPSHAKIGESVTYTLGVTPTGIVPGPLKLTDHLDAALKITQVTLGGAPVACSASPVSVGSLSVSCGADGRSFEIDLQQLGQPLQAQISATILPTAGPQVPNAALLTDSMNVTQTATAALTVDDATTTGASLVMTAGKVLASKGDLVPFVAVVGIPTTAMPLTAGVLALVPTVGLRVGDVRLTAADGTQTIVKPTESAGALTVALPTLAAGQTATVTARARVTGRAGPGGHERLQASVSQGGTALASAQAQVRIIVEPEFDLATLVGEVYRDENRNGVRDPGERGVEGASVVMDDGLQSITDGEGRYHLAAVRPGERALKLAAHTLPPGSQFTTDETRVLTVTAGIVLKVDFGVAVPDPEPPRPRPQAPSQQLPELRVNDAGGLVYRLTGTAQPGAHVTVSGRAARVDKSGAWSADVMLARGRTRLAQVTSYADGRVVVSGRDVFWVDRAQGGSLVVPRAEEPRLTLRFPPAALAEPTFLLEGVATAPIAQLVIAGQKLAPDDKGRVAVRLRVPEAGAGIAAEVAFSDGLTARFDQQLTAGGDFVLLVGLVEGKAGYVVRDGAAGPSSYLAEGRVKLYAKGRIKGRWLLEGGLDVDSTQISSWRDLFRGDPQRVFRNLDPDRFYTVYGDSSATSAPVNSRARLFVRITVDRSELLFGNLQTGLTGVEMGRYSRAVTGGRLSFVRASADDPDGPPTTQVILFGAWLQTARAHDELRGTGGSLYYLSHRNVVEGSEQVRIELRDRVSERPETNTTQRATLDYEVDYLAGRVILRDPLSSFAAGPQLVRSSQNDGDRSYLVIDYEYVVDGDVDDGAAGARATQKIGPVRLGGTVVNEFRSIGSYTLLGGDLQIDLKKYGVVIGEYARSSGSLTSFGRSDDGGLTFADAQGPQASSGQRQGNAWKAEADLHGFGITVRPYVKGIDQGYTDTAHAQDAGFLQFGGEVEAKFGKFKLRAHYDERRYRQLVYDAAGAAINDAGGHQATLDETRRDAGGEIGVQLGIVGLRVGARTERADDADPTRSGHRSAVAARIDLQIVPKLTLYGSGQYSVERGGGNGLLARDNSLVAVGAIVQLPWKTKVTAEISQSLPYGSFTDVRGLGGLLQLKSEAGPGRILYGTVTLSQDRDDRLISTVTAGGRERITDGKGNARALLFAEDQFRDGPAETGGRAHVLATGIEIPLAKKLLFGATFERGEVATSGSPFSSGAQQPLDRTAGTLSASYGGEKLRVQARAELRSDAVAQATGPGVAALQWLASGMLTWKPHKDFTVRSKIFFSHSTASATSLARSTEATVGFAWRPSFTDRVALLGRYTYLDEGVPSAQGQNGPLDPATGKPLTLRELAHVTSLGGEARLFWRFSLGEKLAAKYRSEPDEGTAQWLILWVNRLSLHVTKRWDAVAEYRLLTVPGVSTTHGVAIEGNVILVGHMRLGAGWNFADFSDNELTLGRGRENGFFARAEGFY